MRIGLYEPDVDEAGTVINDLAVLALVERRALVPLGPVGLARVGVHDRSRHRLNVLRVIRLLIVLLSLRVVRLPRRTDALYRVGAAVSLSSPDGLVGAN